MKLNSYIPWRLSKFGGFWNTVFFRPLRQWLYFKYLNLRLKKSSDSITIIIGIKNRVDHKIINALTSIKLQSYNRDKIKTLIVDYGSDLEKSQALIQLCEEYGVNYIRAPYVSDWCRSHCLNIGIKLADTKYILTSDVDIIFPKDYISCVIQSLKTAPNSIVYSVSNDLSESGHELLINYAKDRQLNVKRLNEYSSHRFKNEFSKGINAGLRIHYIYLRGYDEKYKKWGLEDMDLHKRFIYYGLKAVSIADESAYFHQWHEKWDGVDDDNFKEVLSWNKNYFNSTESIIRNPSHWGTLS